MDKSGAHPSEPRGELDKNTIRRTMRGQKPVLRACYESELLVAPDFAPSLMVSFTVDPAGAVSSVTVAGAERPTMEACVIGVISKMVFPSPKGGAMVQVRYPLHFKAAPNAAAP